MNASRLWHVYVLPLTTFAVFMISAIAPVASTPGNATEVLVLSTQSTDESDEEAALVQLLEQQGYQVNRSLMGRELQRLVFDGDWIAALNASDVVVIGTHAPSWEVDGAIFSCPERLLPYTIRVTDELRDVARPVLTSSMTTAGELIQQIESALSSQNWPSVAFSVDARADFNANGFYDIEDMTLLGKLVREPSGDLRGDLDGDGTVSSNDLTTLSRNFWQTYLGDANLNGGFGTDDLVFVFQAGKYETGQSADWSEGDWNVDGVFDSTDFIAAFNANAGFCIGPRTAVPVPEPSYGIGALMIALLLRRRQLAAMTSHAT